MTSPPEPGRPRVAARASPRAVLGGAVIAVLVALGLYAAAPWLLPVRIIEGPMLQMAGSDGVTLVWYTTRPAHCDVQVTVDGQIQTVAAVAEGRRHRVRLTGLAPGTPYPYEIRSADRRLTDDLVFQTNRVSGERFSFLVFGDSGRGTRAQYLLAEEMNRVEPPADFLLHTGDLVYTDGARRRYEARFFAPYRRLLARVNFWPCLGNHDVNRSDTTVPHSEGGSAAAYEEVFEVPMNGPPGLPPKYNYWFDYATARVVVIDSNADEGVLRDQVAPWLQQVLADPAPRWRFVAFHHPPYTGGKYRGDLRIQRALVPAIEAASVDIVFNGHDHMYQRLRPLRGGQIVPDGEGVLYVITAAGGASLYTPVAERPEYVAALNHLDFSFTQVSVAGDELTLRQIALDGHVIDESTLHKAAPEQGTSQPASTPS